MAVTRQCSCGEPLDQDDRFCPLCGAQTPAPSGAGDAAAVTSWGGVGASLRAATQGEYEIVRELGRGGMAAVFLANEPALGRQIAIKVMSPDLMRGEGMVERFRQEAQVAARLSHPHIVTIHAIRFTAGIHFMVMKFVDGKPLDELIRGYGALPVSVALALLGQVGEALEYAHRRGVVHRDVKPGNILVDREGNALVADFGIAKVAEGANLTVTGEPIGTPAYMSPEQCDGRPVADRSDQYSFGIMAYELVTGARPFTGSNLTVMRNHLDKPAATPRSLRPDLSGAVEKAILRMLEKEPAKRFASMGEAIRALGCPLLAADDPIRTEIGALLDRPPRVSTVADAISAPSVAPTAVSPVRPAKRPAWPMVGVGVAALTVVAVIVALTKGGESPGGVTTTDSLVVSLASGGSLDSALAAVAPGGRIALAAGRYQVTPGWRIDRAVAIEGVGPDSTWLDLVAGEGIQLGGGDSVRLAGLSITAPPGVETALTVTSQSVLDNVGVRGPGVAGDECGAVGVGVAIVGSSRSRISGSLIAGFCTGIRVADSAAPRIENNKLTANRTGIQYLGGAAGELVGNQVFANGDGVSLFGGSPVLDGNAFESNQNYGLYRSATANPEIRTNRFRANGIDADPPLRP